MNAWVNGEQVAGQEKAVDTAKDDLVNKLTSALDLPSYDAQIRLIELVTEFEEVSGIGSELSRVLYQLLIRSVVESEQPNRQTVYRPIDQVVTTWQIRELQNISPAKHKWAYGANDGAMTPPAEVHTFTLPTGDIDTIVVATDGLSTINNELVASSKNLTLVNPEYGEQASVSIRRL